MKLWALCESETGYLCHAFVHAGDPPGNHLHGPITRVIIHLLEKAGCTGQKYHLWTDNYFTRNIFTCFTFLTFK